MQNTVLIERNQRNTRIEALESTSENTQETQRRAVLDNMRAACMERRLVVVVLEVLFILTNGALANIELGLSSDNPSSAMESPLCSRSDPAMDPSYEIRYGQDVVWQIPPNPKAVLFLAHGMNKEPLSYFDPMPNCRQCYGLPEDRRAVLAALDRGYAVIMVKSVGSYWLPWSVEGWPPPASEDRTIVVSVIREWTREHSLEHLPLAAFGYSSGGNFTTVLTLDLDVKSLVVMCTSGELEVLRNANASFPPTLFILEPIDNGPDGFYLKGLIAINILNSKGVLTKEINVWPRPIHPLSFSNSIPCIEKATSEKIYGAYKAESWLDDKDYLIKSPYVFDWKAVLWKHDSLPFCDTINDLCFVKHVEEEIMTAWAFHSISSSANGDMFNWFDDTVFLGATEPAGSWASR